VTSGHGAYHRGVATPPGRRLGLALSAVYGTAVLLVGLWPSHVDQNIPVLTFWPGTWLVDHGMSPETAYRLIESAANALFFVPLGAIAVLLLGRSRWKLAVAAGLIASAAIETLQAIALPGRTAALSDVVANTLGAALGVGLVLALGRTTAARDRAS